MANCILITGGAGFIGSHVADELLRHGYRVRALDNLSAQVHGVGAVRPAYLDPRVDLRVGDVRDASALNEALDGVDAVVHLAASVGVGQSMYAIRAYTDANEVGTAALLEALVDRPVHRLVVASSMSVYGEGSYRDAAGRLYQDVDRPLHHLREGRWEPTSGYGEALMPVPTDEAKTPVLSSVYALSKHGQEHMCLLVGRARGIQTVALRLFNVFGPRQSLSNPYTGVLAIFASRLLNDRRPLVFEDGRQRRDFVSVHDVARAFRLALEHESVHGRPLNIASGRSRTIREVASLMAYRMGRPHLAPHVTGRYRMGDVRHCFADIRRARAQLGYAPRTTFEAGLAELVTWLCDQRAEDRVEEAGRELAERGLTL